MREIGYACGFDKLSQQGLALLLDALKEFAAKKDRGSIHQPTPIRA